MTDEKNSVDSDSHHIARALKTAVPEVPRRRVLQTLGVLGAAKLAGCLDMEDGEDEGGQLGGSPAESASDEETELEMDANIAQLIERHDEQLANKSYTLDITLNGEGTDPETTKQIEYSKETEPNRVVSLVTESTVDDGVETFKHFFAPQFQAVELLLDDGTNLAAQINLPASVLEITGGSIFDTYLLGASIADPEETEHEATSEPVGLYDVDFHRGMDLQEGEIAVGSDGIIRMFRLEWLGDDGIPRWIELTTHDVDATTIDTPV